MKNSKLNPIILLLFTLILLSGCGKQTTIKTTFDDTRNNNAINHIVVVSIGKNHPSDNLRFENKLVTMISQKGFKSTGFHTSKSPTDDISETSVKALVDEVNADAVVVTKLVSIDYDASIKPGRSEVAKKPSAHSLVNIFKEYEYTDLNNPERLIINTDVKINTSLYSVKTGKLIWSADTATFKRDDADNVMNDFATKISTELRKKLR